MSSRIPLPRIAAICILLSIACGMWAQESKGPRLVISLAPQGREVQIAWPVTATAQVLEEAPAPTGPWRAFDAAARLVDGRFVATVTPAPSPRFFRLRQAENRGAEFRIQDHWPAAGAIEVGVTVRPQVIFSQPINGATLTTNNLYATAGGRVLPAAVVPATDGSFAWLFFKEPMPGGTRVRVTVDGSTVAAQTGNAQLDADGDGKPGGLFQFEFTTVSLAEIAGTSLTGIVVDPGPDLVPRSADDFDAGPDGRMGTADDTYRLPIEGVRVHLHGQATNAVVTGRDGRFRFPGVPVGNVKVVVDGTRAVQPPAGMYFPEMVLDADMVVGRENWAMTNGAEIYLPRLSRGILQSVAGSATNTIKATAEGAPFLSAFQRNQLGIEVRPNSLVSTNGQALAAGQIGISTVPPDVVRDMLPPGVLQHTFDITVQAPGVAALSTPAPMTFPNVFNQPPGTKLHFLSFDHTTGRLVIEGTATVSEDGASVRTDPGTGITHPGWHGLTPPGTPNDPPEPPDPDCQPELVDADGDENEADEAGLQALGGKTAHETADVPPAETEGLQHYFFVRDGESFTMRFRNAAPPATRSPQVCAPGSTAPKPLVVRLSITGNQGPDRFLEGIDAHLARPFLLRAGQEKRIKVTLAPLLKNIRKVEMDRLYGARIVVHGWELGNRARLLINRTFYVGRYLDAADADHTDGLLSLSPTAIGHDGIRGVIRTREYEVRGVELPMRLAPGQEDKPFFTLFRDLHFAPSLRGPVATADLEVVTPEREVMGRLQAEGEARLQEYFVDAAKLRAALARAAAGQIDGVSAEQRQFLNADGALDRIVDRTLREADALLEPYVAGIRRTLTESATGIRVTAFDSAGAAIPLGPDDAKVLGRSSSIDFCSLDSMVCFSTFGVGGAGSVHPLVELINLAPKISKAEAAFRLSASLNRVPTDTFEVYVDHFLTARRREGPPYVLTEDKLVLELSTTIVHEIGHTLGLVHTYNSAVARATGGCGCALQANGTPLRDYRADLMSHGEQLGRPVFTVSGSAFQTALGLEFSAAEAMRAIDYFAASHRGARKARDGMTLRALDNGWDEGDDRMLSGDEESEGSLILYSASAEESLTGSHDFGRVSADGSGGKYAEQAFLLSNVGDKPVTIRSTRLTGEGLDGFNLTSVAAGTVIPGNDSVPITVRFDPVATGPAGFTLELTHDGEEETTELEVSGFGLSPGPDLRIVTPNNNLGGAVAGGVETIARGFGTLTNIGSTELVITSISASGVNGFRVPASGLPAGFGPNPIRLAPGQGIPFDLAFKPDRTGLFRGQILVASNDPDSPTLTVTVVGTGLPASGSSLDYGQDFAAMESPDFPEGPVLRARTDDAGRFEFFLPPDQRYHAAIFDPVSGLIAHCLGITASSGRNTEIGTPVFLPSRAPDSDGDGLPDDIEFAIGSNPGQADTDRNGLDDYLEAVQGRNPVGDALAVTGIVGRAQVSQARSVTLVPPDTANPDALHAYVAAGEMVVMDVTRPTQPAVLGTLRVSGSVQDIAVDPTTRLAVLAADVNRFSTSTGLFLVDISTPTSPQLAKSFGFPALQVEAFNGHAYALAPAVGAGSELRSLDLVQQSLDQTLPLPVRSVDSMVREANQLYVLGDRTLLVVTVDGTAMTARGRLAVPFAKGRMTVANGIAYLPVEGDGFNIPGGYATVDVADPDRPVLIQASQAPRGVATPGAIVQVNGSGLVLLAGAGGAAQPWVLDVMNGASPTNTYSFLTRFPLGRSIPIDVAVGGGLAFVATHDAGVLVVNYLAADIRGEAPRIQNVQALPDADPAVPGVQLIEGRDFHVRFGLLEDVQVRAVELLVDGAVVQRSVSFPWNLGGVAPPRSAQKTTVSIQLRAVDTGGNVTLSEPVLAELMFDPTVAALTAIDPAEGESKGRGFARARITFSKPMGRSAADVAGYELRRAGGERLPVTSAVLRDGDRVAEVNFARLEAGAYQLTIRAASIRDRAGKPLTGPDLIRNFVVDPYSIRWANASGREGSWFQPTNWIPQRVPGLEDTVLIDIRSTNAPVVIAAPGEWQLLGIRLPVQVRSLDSTEPIALAGVEFRADERLRTDSTVFGFSAAVMNTRWVGGDACYVYGVFELGGVTMEGNFEVSTRGYPFQGSSNQAITPNGASFDLRESFTLNGTITNATLPGTTFGSYRIPYAMTIDGTGTLLNPSLLAAAQASTSEREPFREEIVIGPGITMRGRQFLSVGGRDNRLINRGRVVFDVPYDRLALGPRSMINVGGDANTTNEFVNLGTIEVQNRAFAQIDATFRDRFLQRGVLRAVDGGFLQLNAYSVADRIECEGDAVCDLNGVLITEPGRITELAGSGRWYASRNSQFAGSLQVPARLLPDPGSEPPPPATGPTGVVRLTRGAVLEGSTTFNDITFEGELHNYNPNSRSPPLPPQLRGYGGDIVVRTNLTLQGSITFHRTAADTTPARMLWAGGRHRLEGRGRVVFEAAAFPGTFGGDGSEVTIGPDITVDADGVAFGTGGRISTFPYPFIHNLGTIVAARPGSTVLLNSLTFTNSGTIRIGSGVVLTNNYAFEQTAGGSISIAVGGNQPGVSHGQLRNVRETVLNGRLELELDPGYVPTVGTTLELLTHPVRRGTFASIVAPAPAGLGWLPEYGPSAVRLRLAAAPGLQGAFASDRGPAPVGAEAPCTHAVVPDAGPFPPLPLTVMAWVNIAKSPKGLAGIVCRSSPEESDNFGLGLWDGRVRAWNGRQAIVGADPTPSIDGGFIADGQWHHLALVVDHDRLVLHVDGVRIAATPAQPAAATASGESDGTQAPALRFGSLNGATGCFPGHLGEISLWNAALEPSEIEDFVALKAVDAADARLAGLWSFDTVTDGTVEDRSGRGQNATWLPGGEPTPAGLGE